MHHSNQTLDKKIAEEFKTNFVQVSIQDSESIFIKFNIIKFLP